MEKVENATIPKIEIVCNSTEFEYIAKAVGYGIEEEGLPYHITVGEATPKDAYELSQSPGLGVGIWVGEGTVAVFCRQLKEVRPIFESIITELETGKTMGKNAARIIKNKPFLDIKE